MGIDSVEYHRENVLRGADDHPGAALAYYGSRGETPLEWGGALSSRLGLAGRVTDETYDAVFGPGGAIDPLLGARMVRTRRPGVELVVSAHKSVAVLGVLGRVDDMHEIVDAESDATLAFLDSWFARQGGRRGRAQTRTATSGLLWARTRHLTTRAGDPEPHDHVLIANLTEMLDTRGGWKALDTGGLRDLVHAATMVGRLASAEKAVELGYAIEPDPGPSGKLGHWRLAGIAQPVLELFSKRSVEIDVAVDAVGFDGYRARGWAARASRAAKPGEDEPDLWSRWRHEMTEAGFDPELLRHRFETANRRAAPAPRALTSAQRVELADRLLAVDGPLADRKAFTRADVIRAATPLLYGCRSDELDRVVADVTQHRDAVALIGQPGARNRSWAVASVLDTEDSLAGCADRLARRTDAAHCPEIGRHRAAVSRWQVHGHHLTPGQAHAIKAVLTSRRGLDVIIGVAGSGKTTALRTVHGAFALKGYRVIGTATSGQAARGLREGADVASHTVASLVHRLDRGQLTLDARTVLLIDEAGMTDDRSMLRLLQAVEQARAKAVIIGDHRQLSAVGPGGGLEALTRRHPGAVHVLAGNVRQTDPVERRALECLRAGDPTAAIDWYAAAGRITTASTRTDAIDRAVTAWSADRDAGLDTVLLAWRRADVAALNRTARIDQIAKGHVHGPELEAPGGRRYATGDQVVMLTPDRNARWVTSERGAVTGLEAGAGALTIDFGPKRTVTLAGTDIDDDHVDHAYAVTVHRTQGATVDTAHVLADGGGRELAYVAMSRARLTTHVHTVADDLDQAREDLARDWTTERRDRWIHDTDAPATEGDHLRPFVARTPDERVRQHQTAPEREHLMVLLDDEIAHRQKIEAAHRRLDAIQHRQPPGQGLGIG
jgi:conjugative relaxase-like TrwC/TraI family protein